MRWQGRIYNEFRLWMRWHDYFSIMIHNFPIVLVRRYDWMDSESSTYAILICGFLVYQHVGPWEAGPGESTTGDN